MKKKYLSLIAAAISAGIALSGCNGAQADSVELEFPYTCTVQITKGEESFSATLERDESGGWTAVFSSPETISEMTVRSFGESCTVEYLGLSAELEMTSVPTGAVVATVTSCLDHAAMSSSVKCVKDGSDKLVQGEVASGEYVLRVNKSGEIVSLNVGSDFCAEFTDFEKTI